jgi:PAS domain S-box-containing protein
MALQIDRAKRPEGMSVRRQFLAASAALLMLGAVGAFLVGGNPAVIAESLDPFLAFLVSPWMFATYGLTALFLAYGFWFAHGLSADTNERPDFERILGRRKLHLVFVFAACVVGLVGVGYWFVRDLTATSRLDRFAQQTLVATLKAEQVDKWLYERSIMVETLGAALRRLPLGQGPLGTESLQIVRVLFAELMAGSPERVGVGLFAPDGSVLASAGQAEEREDIAAQVRQVARSRLVGLQIVDRSAQTGPYAKPRIDFVLPITASGAAGPVLAFLDIALDPTRELLNSVRSWPTNSRSSEALLVRRQGDDVVFVTPPRGVAGGPEAAPWFRLPLSTPNLPAAAAILRGPNVYQGRDYRGVDAITASARVRGIDWYVVAKTDTDEVMQPLHRRIVTLVLVIAVSIVVAGLMVVMLWRGERAGYLAFRAQQKDERTALSKHFEQMIRSARDIVFLFDPAGNIVDCNESAVAAYGYSADELKELNIRDLLPPDEVANFARLWPEGEAPEGHLVESVHRRRDGTTFPIEVSSSPVTAGEKLYRQAFIRDISRRKALEARLGRVGRAQRGLFEAAGILLRARSEEVLFQGMCDVIVGVGGYRLAGVAIPNRDAGKTVRVVATAGTDLGYLAQAAISWGDGPQGMGPTGAAIRTGEIQVNQDFASNPRMAPWRGEAIKRGLQASIGLPLRASGEVFGALTIYSGQPDAFDEEEVALLSRFAEDISYGVTTLRARAGTGAVWPIA